METKMIRVPFEVEIAKRIQNKECEGRIVTRDGRNARIVCWDKKSDSIYNIVALLEVNTKELICTYSVNGFEVVEKESDNDLMLEIPEYMTFKDGDVLTSRGCPFIFKGYRNNGCMFYAGINATNNLVISNGSLLWTFDSSDCTFSAEEERQKLIDALKANKEPQAKECLKKLGVEVKPKCEFKPFDKVLARSDEEDEWRADIFSHINKNKKFSCVGYDWNQCIPYNEQTAHLLGTTENYE